MRTSPMTIVTYSVTDCSRLQAVVVYRDLEDKIPFESFDFAEIE